METPKDFPDGDISELASMAVTAHELFMEFGRAGFDPRQSMYAAMAVLTENPLLAPPGAPDNPRD